MYTLCRQLMLLLFFILLPIYLDDYIPLYSVLIPLWCLEFFCCLQLIHLFFKDGKKKKIITKYKTKQIRFTFDYCFTLIHFYFFF
jgi:hypothetical protein